VVKERFKKKYRIVELDESLTRQRILSVVYLHEMTLFLFLLLSSLSCGY